MSRPLAPGARKTISRRRDGEAGFSLIEALAGLALAATILLGLGAVAGQWLPQWRHGFAALEKADLIGLALDRIVEDVGAAEYAQFKRKGAPLFRGEPDAITFVRQAIGPSAGPRLEVVRIGAVDTRLGPQVERARADFTPDGVGAFGDATTLLPAPLRLTFAYAGGQGGWRSAWSGEFLPRAITLTVERPDGSVIASTAFALKVTAPPDIAAPPDAKTALRAGAK